MNPLSANNKCKPPFTIILIALGVLPLVWLVVSGTNHSPNILSKDTLWILQEPDKFVLMSIRPDSSERDWALGITNAVAREEIKKFRNYELLGSADITNRFEQAELVKTLAMALQKSSRKQPACFDPHHALLVQRGVKSVDLVICFQCVTVREYTADGLHTLTLDAAPEYRKTFDAALSRYGLIISTHSP